MADNIANRDREILRIMTLGAYDLQMLRIQTGLRLCANFRSKMADQKKAAEATESEEDEEQQEELELSEEAEKIIDQLKASFRRLTDGVAKNRTLPQEKGFTGDELISSFTELVLVDQYLKIEANERSQFRQLETALDKLAIYRDYLQGVRGIGPAMSAVLISYFDIHKAHHVSAFWSYAGLDVAPDGRGRSRRQEHLIDRQYTKKDGTEATKRSVTYNPWVKSRLLGALATSFMRTSGCPWRKLYDDYKHRISTDPSREKVTSAVYKKRFAAKQDVNKLWPPLRIHRAALRYMVKLFLVDFWKAWRRVEGLDVGLTYAEDKHNHVHGQETPSWPSTRATGS